MIPDESAEVVEVVTNELVAVDIFVEVEPAGVVLTFGADDREEDISVLLSPTRAREVGELLFTRSYEVE